MWLLPDTQGAASSAYSSSFRAKCPLFISPLKNICVCFIGLFDIVMDQWFCKQNLCLPNGFFTLSSCGSFVKVGHASIVKKTKNFQGHIIEFTSNFVLILFYYSVIGFKNLHEALACLAPQSAVPFACTSLLSPQPFSER